MRLRENRKGKKKEKKERKNSIRTKAKFHPVCAGRYMRMQTKKNDEEEWSENGEHFRNNPSQQKQGPWFYLLLVQKEKRPCNACHVSCPLQTNRTLKIELNIVLLAFMEALREPWSETLNKPQMLHTTKVTSKFSMGERQRSIEYTIC